MRLSNRVPDPRFPEPSGTAPPTGEFKKAPLNYLRFGYAHWGDAGAPSEGSRRRTRDSQVTSEDGMIHPRPDKFLECGRLNSCSDTQRVKKATA